LASRRNKKLYRKTRKNEHHHPGADNDRLYVPRKEEGRGLMQIEGAYIAEVMKIRWNIQKVK